jgi:hypothetical protein
MQRTGQIVPPDTSASTVYPSSRGKMSTDSTADLQSILTGSIQKEQSLFNSHLPKGSLSRPKSFNAFQPDWILGILLAGFIFLAWVQVFYRNRFRQILMAPFSKRFLSQLIRDGDLVSERISIALGFIYLITTSLLFYQAGDLLLDKKIWAFFLGFKGFVIIGGLLLGFWIAKVSLIKFLAMIFRTRQTTDEYLLNIFIFSALTGIFLLPFLVVVIYLKSVFFLWICLSLSVLFLIVRFVRGFLIGTSNTKFSYLFLFVYLCGLEILPLIILTKLLFLYPF